MITAHFIVDGEERETREVSEDWLRRAATEHENVLLQDGNTYLVKSVGVSGGRARVELVPPQFARGS
jgi:hypothetical protein